MRSEADTGFSERGSVGCPGMNIEYLGNFVAGHIMQYADKMPAYKMPVDKIPHQNCKAGQNAGHFIAHFSCSY